MTSIVLQNSAPGVDAPGPIFYDSQLFDTLCNLFGQYLVSLLLEDFDGITQFLNIFDQYVVVNYFSFIN